LPGRRAGEGGARGGGVLSRLTVTLTAPVFPATSVALPLTAWLAPSVTTVTGPLAVATPESASVAWKPTVTSELFQPLALGAGVTTAVTAGAVLSILSVTAA